MKIYFTISMIVAGLLANVGCQRPAPARQPYASSPAMQQQPTMQPQQSVPSSQRGAYSSPRQSAPSRQGGTYSSPQQSIPSRQGSGSGLSSTPSSRGVPQQSPASPQ